MDMEEKIQALTAPLTKDDVEFRVGTCNKNGFSLLAYKTARVDTKRLNDVFGTSWTNNYFYDSKGLLCCKIGVYDGRVGGFVYREDVGTESYTEKEKGSYSDAFKRAGFKWGIGVELYNTGLIWIKGNTKEINGKWRPTIYTSQIFINEMTVKSGVPYFSLSLGNQPLFNNMPKEKSKKEEWLEFVSICRELNIDDEKAFLFDYIGINNDKKEEIEKAVRYYNDNKEELRKAALDYLEEKHAS